MNRVNAAPRVVLLLAACAAATGCASNQWATNFQPVAAAPATEAPLAQNAQIAVREVPWGPFTELLQRLQARIAQDPRPLDQWPEPERTALKRDFLDGLNITLDPATITVLGRSEFRTTDFSAPDQNQIVEAARKVGANSVIWSGNYLGKVQSVQSQPVYAPASGYFGYRPDPVYYSRTYDPSVLYVPVVVSEDEYAYIAFFMRIQ